MAKKNPLFMSGVPELLVLRILSNKEMYGYELVREIRKSSNEAFNLAEGVVYPLLHTLEQGGVLKAKSRLVGKRNRIYYSVTASGRRRLTQLREEWGRVSSGIDTVFGSSYVS